MLKLYSRFIDLFLIVTISRIRFWESRSPDLKPRTPRLFAGFATRAAFARVGVAVGPEDFPRSAALHLFRGLNAQQIERRHQLPLHQPAQAQQKIPLRSVGFRENVMVVIKKIKRLR